jgi:hypothetical protein
MKSFYSKCDSEAMLRKSMRKCFVYVEDMTSGHNLLALRSEGESNVKDEHRELRMSMSELKVSTSLEIRHESLRSLNSLI